MKMAYACSVLALLCPVMAVIGESTRRIVGLNQYRGPCVLSTFSMLDLMVYGRNGAQTLLSSSSFKMYLGLQHDSNFINVIRIQKVTQMYFSDCH